MARVAAYIDGFNLYHGLKARLGRKYLWLDLCAGQELTAPRPVLGADHLFHRTYPIRPGKGKAVDQLHRRAFRPQPAAGSPGWALPAEGPTLPCMRDIMG